MDQPFVSNYVLETAPTGDSLATRRRNDFSNPHVNLFPVQNVLTNQSNVASVDGESMASHYGSKFVHTEWENGWAV